MIRVIAAVSRNGVMGVGNDLPWNLRDDLQLFKRLTLGRVVVMGRKTYESIGKPLPGRENVVLSRSVKSIPGVKVISSLKELTQLCQGEVDFIGGAEIYKLAFETNLVDQAIITHVDCVVGCNKPKKLVFFDFSDLRDFLPTKELMRRDADKDNEFPFNTMKYVRK